MRILHFSQAHRTRYLMVALATVVGLQLVELSGRSWGEAQRPGPREKRVTASVQDVLDWIAMQKVGRPAGRLATSAGERQPER